MIKYFQILIFIIVTPFCYSQQDSIQQFSDYTKIIGFGSSSSNRIIKVDSFSIDWGLKVIAELKVDGLNNFEKAKRIKNYIHKNIGCYGRQSSIHEIIQKKTGNCYDHARISAFILRMAGIPTKFAFEINLRDNAFWWANKAKKQHIGTWGDYHNDHVWVLFYDGINWQPYDSEMDILGIDEFVTKRWEKLSPFYLKILPFGPPFIIWAENGNGFINMKTITKEIWSNKPDNTYTRVSKKEWFDFIDEFDGMTLSIVYKNFFPEEKGKKVKEMCKIWF